MEKRKDMFFSRRSTGLIVIVKVIKNANIHNVMANDNVTSSLNVVQYSSGEHKSCSSDRTDNPLGVNKRRVSGWFFPEVFH